MCRHLLPEGERFGGGFGADAVGNPIKVGGGGAGCRHAGDAFGQAGRLQLANDPDCEQENGNRQDVDAMDAELPNRERTGNDQE